MTTSNPNPASPLNVITISQTASASGLKKGSTTSVGVTKVTLAPWSPVSSTGTGSVNALALGSGSDGTSAGGAYPVGACNGFYGSSSVPYLWQVYDI